MPVRLALASTTWKLGWGIFDRRNGEFSTGLDMGMHLRGRCPLPQHSSRESSESFIVNTGKNVWICHSQSCVAARRLRSRFRAGGPGPPGEEGTGFKKKEGASSRWVVSPAQESNPPLGFVLGPVDHRHPYLSQRGIDGQTAECFQAGFYGGVGMMHKRVVIAIHNQRGQLVAYVGRAIDGREPRYKFPPGFQKSLELFNLHRALRSKSPQVIVVEGFFDCMRVHQAGFPSVVALMGASLSRAQLQLLLDHFEQVVLMLDGDETGRRASRLIAAQPGRQMTLRVVEVPKGQQPDQLTAMEIHRLLEGTSKW